MAARRKSDRVRIQPNRKVKGRMVIRRYQRSADPGARVYTDDFSSYNALPGDKHLSVKHDEDEYSDGNGVHINTAEAEFSVLRPWIATFRGVSKKKLYLYIRHYEFLRNQRHRPHRKNPKNAVNFAYPLPTKMLPTINHASMNMISYKKNMSGRENRRGCEVKNLMKIDVIYFTAGEKGIKKDKPRMSSLRMRGRGTYDEDKQSVMTFTERRRKKRFFVKKNLSKKMIQMRGLKVSQRER